MFEWWHWMVLGLCLSMAELLVPAFFIVWFGIGPLGVGIVLAQQRFAFVEMAARSASASCCSLPPRFRWRRSCSCGRDYRRCSSPSGSDISGRAP